MPRKEYAVVATGMRRVGQPAPLRLTRRGRVVVLTFFIFLASLASAVLWTTASRAEDPPAGPPPTVVVQPDDTLWGIAARIDGGRSPHAVVAEIRRLNGLGTDHVVIHPGTTLVVPRAR
jgi:nucleoid-associated protein YgaU